MRACAAALAGGDVPLGPLPAGTGNLLARNPGIPTDLESAGKVAGAGHLRRIDVRSLDGEPFVVLGGGGFDGRSEVVSGIGVVVGGVGVGRRPQPWQLQRRRAAEIVVRWPAQVPVEIDGDLCAPADVLTFAMSARALDVYVPVSD